MKSERMTPVGIAAWFREKAREFDNIADTLDETFSLSAALEQGVAQGQRDVFPRQNLTEKQRLIGALGGGRSRRIGELSRETGIPEHKIRALATDSDNELVLNERGWVSIPE